MAFLDDTSASPRDAEQSSECSFSSQSTQLDLIRQCDVKGVLHTHTRGDDGAHSLSAMVATAHDIGLEYLGVSDHFRCSTSQNGLDGDGVRRQRDEIEDLKESYPGFDILQGVEVDVCKDGSLPLNDETLSSFDYVIVSLDGSCEKDAKKLTARAIKIIQNPMTRIISKPLGDYMLRQPPVPLDMEAVLQAAAAAKTAVEIDANPHSLDLDWNFCHRAQELGVLLSINPNAHRAARLVDYRHGVELVRNAGICCRTILNTMTSQELRAYFSASA